MFFINLFNEMRGFSPKGSIIANFEKGLAKKNKYEIFKEEFEKTMVIHGRMCVMIFYFIRMISKKLMWK